MNDIDLITARCLQSQLQRDEELSTSLVADLKAALDRSASRLEDGGRDANLAARLESLATDLNTDSADGVTKKRMDALVETLGGIAARLR